MCDAVSQDLRRATSFSNRRQQDRFTPYEAALTPVNELTWPSRRRRRRPRAQRLALAARPALPAGLGHRRSSRSPARPTSTTWCAPAPSPNWPSADCSPTWTGIATPVDPDARTGDLVLDGLLELVEESRPRKWKAWVTLRARVTLDAVRAQLAAEGYLRAEKKRVLGLFPSVEYELERGVRRGRAARGGAAGAGGARARRRGAPTATRPSSPSPPRPNCAPCCRARTASSYKDRIEELTERSGAAAPALKKVIQEVRTAVIVAVITRRRRRARAARGAGCGGG